MEVFHLKKIPKVPIRTWKRGVSLLWRFYLIFSLISIIVVFEDFLIINFNSFHKIQPQEEDKLEPDGKRIPLLMGSHFHQSFSQENSNANSNDNFGISGVRLDIQSQFSIPGWADTRWPFRKNITIDASKVSSDLMNFPVFIEIYDTSLRSTAQTDGDDIVFTDLFGNQLDHEIEVYEPNHNATHARLVTWIKTNLSSTQNSLISMYYGNHTVGSQEHIGEVWDDTYVGVWHLSEQFGNANDSTSFKTDGMVSGGVTRGVLGKTGPSYRFDPSGRFNTSDPGDGHLDFGLGDFSISFWSRVNQDTGSFQGFIQKGARWAGDPGYSVFSDASPISYYQAIVQDSVEVVEAFPGNFAFDTWYYVVTQLDRSTDTLSLFVNGALVDSSNASLIGNIDSSAGLEIPSPTYPIDGFMDEVRLSNIVSSPDWIATEFNNQLNPLSFYSIGMEEHLPDTEPPIVLDFGVDDPGSGTVTFWANITDVTSVDSAEVKINGTEYSMNFNTTHWIYQVSVEFGGYYEYQIVNASDSLGNYLTSPSSPKNHTFNLDSVSPNVLDWEYITENNTFHANVSDPWGAIDTVIVNVTTYYLKAAMVQYTTFGSNILAYMNNTLVMANGPIDFQIIVNDTSGNEYTSPTHPGNVFVNHPPLVGNLTLTPFPLHTYDDLTLSYDYYDMDGNPEVTAEIRWFKNAIYQPAYDDSFIIPASAHTKGEIWNATVKSYDGLEWSDIQDITIIVQNALPVASSVTINGFSSPVQVQDDTNLVVGYVFADADGDLELTSSRKILWYQNSILIVSLNDSLVVTAGNTSIGDTWYYTISVNDGESYSTVEFSPSAAIAVAPNTPPVVDNLTLSPIPLHSYDDLTLSYDYYDVDGDPEVTAEIRWFRNAIYQPTYDDLVTIPASALIKGNVWNVTVRSYDSMDWSSLQESSTSIVQNTPPVVGNLTLSPFPLHSNDDLTLSYDYYDIDGDPEVTEEIRWFRNAIYQPSYDDLVTIPASALIKGDVWNITVKSYDGLEWSAFQASSTIIVQNTPPIVSDVTINGFSSPVQVQDDTDLVVGYTFTDADGDPESTPSRRILWYRNGMLIASLNDSLVVTAGNTSIGENWNYTISVYDGEDYSTVESSLSVTIALTPNAPPVVDNLTFSPFPLHGNDNLTLSYDYYDIDGDPEVTVEIRWFRNAIYQPAYDDLVTIPTSTLIKGDVWNATVRSYDGLYWSNLQTLIIIVQNSTPVATNVTLTPISPNTSQILSTSWVFLDIDLDVETQPIINWYRNGIQVGSLANLSSVPSTATNRDESWYYTIQVSDGTIYSSLYVSNTVVIINSAPTASNVQINEASTTIYTTDLLTVTWEFNDPDSQDSESSVLILWYLYGVGQTQLENNSIIPANYTLKNQEWLVSIGVRDNGGLWSDLVNSSVVVIANSPPTVNNIVLIPEYPNTTENLVANWDYTDADGDLQNSFFITWYKDGIEQAAYMNQNIIPSSETADGDDWYFTLHVSDGTNNSTLEISPHVLIGSSLLVLNIESPTETTYSTETISIYLSGNAEYYWYFIEELDTINQSWTASLDRIVDDGTYTIHAYGNDSSGNTIHVQATFNVDTTPPELSILSPTNGIYGTEVLIDLSGDNDILWLIYNIEGVDIQNQSWSQQVNVSLSDGSYLLHAYGSDSAGNIAHETIFFTVDSIPPIVTIIRPSKNLETPIQSETIKIVWSVIDSSGFSEAEISVNGSFVTRVAFPCCVIEISLAEGLHNIEVMVFDLAGNRGSALVTVLVKSPKEADISDNSTGFSVIFPLLSLIGIGLLLRRRIFIKKEV